MQKHLLLRYQSSDQGTFGILTLQDTRQQFQSLELPWRNNRSSISSIPAGIYECSLTWSPRFGRLMWLVNGVRGRSGIRIHPANLAGDIDLGWQSQLNGCIALGFKTGKMQLDDGKWQKCVLTSRPAVRQFEAAVKSSPFLLEIKDA